jgi:hypothetical protein
MFREIFICIYLLLISVLTANSTDSFFDSWRNYATGGNVSTIASTDHLKYLIM